MFKAIVNNKYDFKIEPESPGKGTVNESPYECDIIEVKHGIFHIIKDNKSYTAEVHAFNHGNFNCEFVICVNCNKYTVQIKDKYDDLLSELGMEMAQGASKVKEVKAPMPGLVMYIRVKEGDTVKKNNAIVVLQAMKMENIIRSPCDGIIKKIHIRKGDAVEKNQILTTFA